MGNEQENVKKIEEGYRRWHEVKGTNAQHWLDLMTDDVCFRSLSAGVPAADFAAGLRSRAKVAGYFEGVSAEWEMVHFTAHEFTAQDDRVAVLGSCAWRSRKTGVVAESPMAHFFKFRDGRIAEVVEFFDTAAGLAAQTVK